MAEKKITKREKNELIIEVLNGRVPSAEEKTMLIEHITHEIELLARKNSKSATLTPSQKDSLAISEIIKDILAESDKGMTVGAILKDNRIATYKCAKGEDVSSQKITSILSKNTADFKRTLDKKVALYSLNYGVVEDSEVEGV